VNTSLDTNPVTGCGQVCLTSVFFSGFLHSIFSGLRRILGSWNLVNPLLRMNEAWKDECAARLQPLVDQYKNPDNTKLSQ